MAEVRKNPNTVIPYRESKLTCLLNQCLGGNAYCLMIACPTPSDKFIDENMSTLNYASKAKVMTNQPKVNDDPKAVKITDLQHEVKGLTKQLTKANETIGFLNTMVGDGTGDKIVG